VEVGDAKVHVLAGPPVLAVELSALGDHVFSIHAPLCRPTVSQSEFDDGMEKNGSHVLFAGLVKPPGGESQVGEKCKPHEKCN
jgi:hypothetical protein